MPSPHPLRGSPEGREEPTGLKQKHCASWYEAVAKPHLGREGKNRIGYQAGQRLIAKRWGLHTRGCDSEVDAYPLVILFCNYRTTHEDCASTRTAPVGRADWLRGGGG